jgi:iduronate 2-sulfatase
LDLVPLIYRTCDVEPPSTLQGEDLSLLLRDSSATLREVVFSEVAGRVMAQTLRYKYAYYQDGSAELYDLEADPHEIENLAGQPAYATVEAEMRGRLLEHELSNHALQMAATAVPQHPLRVAIEEAYRAAREAR